MLLSLKAVETFSTMPTEDVYYLQNVGEQKVKAIYLVSKDMKVYWDGDVSKYRYEDSISFCYYKDNWYLDMDMKELVSYGKQWRLFDTMPSEHELANF